MAKEGGKKVNFLAVCSGAIGVAGAIAWSKKDLAKGVLALGKKNAPPWVQISIEPALYMTPAGEANREALFAHLSQSAWRLVDHIADGYFWLNGQDQILLLSQNSIFLGKYDVWSASRKFVEDEGQS